MKLAVILFLMPWALFAALAAVVVASIRRKMVRRKW